MHVPLDHAPVKLYLWVMGGCTFDVAGEVDAPALATGLGLDYEGLGFSLLPALVVGLQVGVLYW